MTDAFARDELEALPDGSIVKGPSGVVAAKEDSTSVYPWAITGHRGAVSSGAVVRLLGIPLTVIHQPQEAAA